MKQIEKMMTKMLSIRNCTSFVFLTSEVVPSKAAISPSISVKLSKITSKWENFNCQVDNIRETPKYMLRLLPENKFQSPLKTTTESFCIFFLTDFHNKRDILRENDSVVVNRCNETAYVEKIQRDLKILVDSILPFRFVDIRLRKYEKLRDFFSYFELTTISL